MRACSNVLCACVCVKRVHVCVCMRVDSVVRCECKRRGEEMRRLAVGGKPTQSPKIGVQV